MKASKRFFFEKKHQKTFGHQGYRRAASTALPKSKVFCGAFFQKSDRFHGNSQ